MIHRTWEQMLEFFRHSLKRDMHHTFLFIIPSTSNRAILSRQMSGLLLCKGENPPCGRCNACIKVEAGLHPDVNIVGKGDKKSIAIDKVREVSQQAHIKPWEGKYKIFILHDIHLLREEAGNALLKILEEPPPHAMFFLTAQNENAVLPTVLSRCQVFSIGEQTGDVVKTLIDKHEVDKDQARVLFALGEGNLDSALQVKEKRWKNRSLLFGFLIEGKDPIYAGEKFAEACGQGEEGRRTSLVYIDYLASYWRDVLVYQMTEQGVAKSLAVNCDLAVAIERHAKMYNQTRIFKLLEFLLQAKTMIASNVTPALVWENIFLSQRLA